MSPIQESEREHQTKYSARPFDFPRRYALPAFIGAVVSGGMDGWSATSLGLPLPSSFLLFSSLLSELWRVIEAAFVGLIKLRSVARARARARVVGRSDVP